MRWSEVVALYVSELSVGGNILISSQSLRMQERDRLKKGAPTHPSIRCTRSLCYTFFLSYTHISILMTPLLMEWGAREVLDFELE